MKREWAPSNPPHFLRTRSNFPTIRRVNDLLVLKVVQLWTSEVSPPGEWGDRISIEPETLLIARVPGSITCIHIVSPVVSGIMMLADLSFFSQVRSGHLSVDLPVTVTVTFKFLETMVGLTCV